MKQMWKKISKTSIKQLLFLIFSLNQTPLAPALPNSVIIELHIVNQSGSTIFFRKEDEVFEIRNALNHTIALTIIDTEAAISPTPLVYSLLQNQTKELMGKLHLMASLEEGTLTIKNFYYKNDAEYAYPRTSIKITSVSDSVSDYDILLKVRCEIANAVSITLFAIPWKECDD